MIELFDKKKLKKMPYGVDLSVAALQDALERSRNDLGVNINSLLLISNPTECSFIKEDLAKSYKEFSANNVLYSEILGCHIQFVQIPSMNTDSWIFCDKNTGVGYYSEGA